MTDGTRKTCTKCGQTLPLTEFYRHKTTRDGYETHCKPCVRQRTQMNKGIRNPLTRRRFPLAPAGWKFCTTCHYLLPLEEFYRWKSAPDGRTHRCKDCSNELRYNLMTRAARARARAGDGLEFTATEILRLYKAQRGRCRYCGQPLRKTFALDHVVPISKGGGNEPGNVVVACLQCNYLKADLDVEEFRVRHLVAS